MDVIPPLTDVSTASGTIFLSITHAMLTDTNVPEAAPTAYAGGTTYADGDQASDVAANLILVYESLVGGNVGNALTDTDFWLFVGYTYPTYSGGGSWDTDELVIDPTTHLEYKSLVDTNTGNALSDSTKWQLQGVTNRFKAFNLLKSTPSVAGSTMVFEILPGQRVDAVAFFGLVATSIQVEVIVGGSVVWDETEGLSNRTTTSWSEYVFGGFSYRDRYARLDLPPYSSATVRLTITNTAGDVSCGRIILGKQVYVGVVEAGAADGEQNFSSVDRTIGGESTITQRRSISTLRCEVWSDAEADKKLRALRAALNATPAAWIGIQDTTHNYYESLSILGFHRTFDIGLPTKNQIRTNLEVEEA